MSLESREFAADTHAGLRRDQNEDCFGANADVGLWLVADGVGGHSCGEVASGIVRSTVLEQVAQGCSLPEAVQRSHEAVLNAINDGQGAEGMGSTIVAAKLQGNQYELCWVGDSRAYRWDGDLVQLTQDHNRVADLLEKNVIDQKEADSHPQRHVLTQSLGVSSGMDLQPGVTTGELLPGQQLLLCSDGLTDELPDSLIAQLLSEHDSPRAQVDALISAALDAGGRDNITAIVVGNTAIFESVRQDDTLDLTHDTRRSASGGMPNDGKFPVRALLLIGALTIAALAILS